VIRTLRRYRVVPRRDILEMLVLSCWLHDARQGQTHAMQRRAELALEELVRFSLPVARGASAAEERYDPVEVMNLLKVAGEAGACSAWEDHLATARRLVCDFGARAAEAPPPRDFALTLQREFPGSAARRGAPLRLRVPAPLACATQTATTAVRVLGARDFDLDESIPGRVAVVVHAPPADGPITIEARIHVAAAAVRHALASPPARVARLSDEERRLYTAPKERIIVVSPRVRAQAAAIVDGAHTDLEILQRLWHFLRDFEIGHLRYDALDPVDPLGGLLATRWIDCYSGAALLTALCRAQNLPARVVGGYCLYPAGPYYHYWCEVHLEAHGWIPIDFMGPALARKGGDAEWRDLFFGRLDYRLKTECLPRSFTGHIGVPIPPAWYVVSAIHGRGAERRYYDVDTQALLYRDIITVDELNSRG
jgi:hypothetical protein